MAETYYVAVAPHHEGGPTAAGLNLAATLPYFYLQHTPFPEAAEDGRMRAKSASAALEKIKDGFAALPSTPGLSITINESALEQYHAASRIPGIGRRRPRVWRTARAGSCGQLRLDHGASRCRGRCLRRLHSGLTITGMKVFGVSLTPQSDRPYVFVKLETDQGVVGWGEGALEGKAAAVMACMNDFHDFLIGDDPRQVEHIWQSMYIHSLYRAGPVIGSAISGIDQALWDIRGNVLGMSVYQLLGGPVDARGVRGYYHSRANIREDLLKHRETALQQGVSYFKYAIPGVYEYIETHAKIERAVKSMRTLRENLGPDINIAVAFHAKTSPSVASVIVKEVEPLNLLFIEEPCPPENVAPVARIARRSTTPIATGERLDRFLRLPRVDRDGHHQHPADRH